jgi:hypothetical protein
LNLGLRLLGGRKPGSNNSADFSAKASDAFQAGFQLDHPEPCPEKETARLALLNDSPRIFQLTPPIGLTPFL